MKTLSTAITEFNSYYHWLLEVDRLIIAETGQSVMSQNFGIADGLYYREGADTRTAAEIIIERLFNVTIEII